MSKSNITISIDFLAGTSIKDAVKEACDLCIDMNIAYVCFNFNGVSISVGQNCDLEAALLAWKKDGINSKYGHVFN